MTYNEYRIHLLTCEYLNKEPTGQYKKIHDFLTELWEGMEILVDSSTNRIALQKEGECLFAQNQENGFLWCQYEQVWSFFWSDMGMEYPDTQDFIKSTVEEHLKCEVGTPRRRKALHLYPVEEHLKCEVGTPLDGERHSK